ncbi:hypothetical protein DAPPUDRAFT_120413 [Daphnia pulex]|uniref:Uncharacterized protein n=1 Tax=Daphnia pulex TaxID=6669 RepID=E9I1A6_DAPPU|nr:hypothetical protein DAPPUDRAFT_120413 [Daphnia pulex]|eukprot:EFX62224.1 hypothetical protein DAPPUDRAFT_120413 [Daphnia pulex]
MIREDGSISSAELSNARTKQRCNLINKLNSENPLLKGRITSVRILFNRADFSFVRLSLLCKDTRDRYLEQGRLKLDNLSHAVIEVDYNKEGISLPSALVVNGSTVSDANLILKQCALHFFPTEPLSLPSHLVVESFVDDVVSVPSVIEGPPVTVEELDAALDSINYKAAPGSDGLSAAIIKECFPVLKAHLLFISHPLFCMGAPYGPLFLATKKGVKCVRSFQRVFAIARTKSFKTTSTDALLVLAKVDPIDFIVMKTAYLRLSTSNYANFSCSTKKWLGKYFPDVLLLPTPGGYSLSPLPPRWPPWVCLPKPIQLQQGCSLLRASAQVIRIFVATARSAGIPRFAIFSANHKNVVDLDSGALPVFTSDNMTNLFAMHRALVLTARELQSHEMWKSSLFLLNCLVFLF